MSAYATILAGYISTVATGYRLLVLPRHTAPPYYASPYGKSVRALPLHRINLSTV